ncbi:hypothetical protein CCR75_008714 [Bremia lactucae]|uniref:Nuclear pore complex protein Nup88 n=1 Tax=Bremia lactucae TaxID=4779 RepID=A0A976IK45_BRELC|nr:hypothetical protein CCR75_008714 [Bremia lactucae]
MTHTDDDWALRNSLQLCGSIIPPNYADLRTAAHLQTFDVFDGCAALWADSGKLFLVNILQSQVKPAKEQLLRHVTLEPSLQPREAAEVEQVKINAIGSQVLLVAKSWVKIFRLPSMKKLKPPHLQRQTDRVATQRFLVRFEDCSEQEVLLQMNELQEDDNIAEQVKRLVSSSKRVVMISREHSVAAVRSVGYFSTVRHAAWHPCSDAHVVVLSDAEELEVFNTQHDVSKAEQRHRLDFPTKTRASVAFTTHFCFSASIQLQQAAQIQVGQLWDAFTCYVLRSDGAVYALCPLVPYECCVSKGFLQLLSSEVDAQIAILKQKFKTSGSGSNLQTRLGELKSQKYWLQEGWGPTNGQIENEKDISVDANVMHYLSPHMSGISPDTWPVALQGPVKVAPQSELEEKVLTSKRFWATSLLVGPLGSRSFVEKHPVNTSPFLMRTFASGHVELILLDAPIRPHWQSNRQLATAVVDRYIPALLLECLNLGFDDSGGKLVLERDAADPRLVYCLHSTGVHVININWVSALASGKQFTSLPKSSVRHIFSVSPNINDTLNTAVTNVVGARLVKNVNFGHLLLLRLASGSFEIVNMSAASSELLKGVLVDNSNDDGYVQKMLPSTLASLASSKSCAVASTGTSNDGNIRAFGEIVEEKLEALSARGTRVTGNTQMHKVDDAVVAFVLERVKILYEDVEFIDEMDQSMHDRLQLLTTMIEMQLKQVVAVQKNAIDARTSMENLKKKTERALAVQQNLSKRAAAVLQAVKENQPHLSRAEREFKSELELMALEVRRMKPRIAEMTVEGQRAVRLLESAVPSASSPHHCWASCSSSGSLSVLSNEKKKMCFDVLRAETQLIDNTKVLLDDLSSNVQQLKE